MNRVAEIIDLKWAHSRQITGKNVGVAVLDTGVWMHPDFVNETGRIIGFKDILQDLKIYYRIENRCMTIMGMEHMFAVSWVEMEWLPRGNILELHQNVI